MLLMIPNSRLRCGNLQGIDTRKARIPSKISLQRYIYIGLKISLQKAIPSKIYRPSKSYPFKKLYIGLKVHKKLSLQIYICIYIGLKILCPGYRMAVWQSQKEGLSKAFERLFRGLVKAFEKPFKGLLKAFERFFKGLLKAL